MAKKIATVKTAKKSKVKLATKEVAKVASPTTTKKPVAKSKPSKASKPKVRSETIKSWYDYPELYEMGFLKETPKESLFMGDVFKKYVPFPVKRVLELGCGSGRLICDMAKRGYAMTGLDLNPTALE